MHGGLVGALQDYVESVRTPSGPRLQLLTDGVADLEQLPESVEVTAYRIATESVTNVLRHANADSASITLWLEENQLQMKITDDGVVRTPRAAGSDSRQCVSGRPRSGAASLPARRTAEAKFECHSHWRLHAHGYGR